MRLVLISAAILVFGGLDQLFEFRGSCHGRWTCATRGVDSRFFPPLSSVFVMGWNTGSIIGLFLRAGP